MSGSAPFPPLNKIMSERPCFILAVILAGQASCQLAPVLERWLWWQGAALGGRRVCLASGGCHLWLVAPAASLSPGVNTRQQHRRPHHSIGADSGKCLLLCQFNRRPSLTLVNVASQHCKEPIQPTDVNRAAAESSQKTSLENRDEWIKREWAMPASPLSWSHVAHFSTRKVWSHCFL